MKSITLTIEITDQEFEALQKIEAEKIAEFRDNENTWEEYAETHKDVISQSPDVWTETRFLRRNFYGLRKEVLSLYEKDLVEMVEDAWHLTFQISELGMKFFN
jgi:hypothetical protein